MSDGWRRILGIYNLILPTAPSIAEQQTACTRPPNSLCIPTATHSINPHKFVSYHIIFKGSSPSIQHNGISHAIPSHARPRNSFRSSPHNQKLPNIVKKTRRGCYAIACTETSWRFQRRVRRVQVHSSWWCEMIGKTFVLFSAKQATRLAIQPALNYQCRWLTFSHLQIARFLLGKHTHWSGCLLLRFGGVQGVQ